MKKVVQIFIKFQFCAKRMSNSPSKSSETIEISWEDWRDFLILSPQIDSLPEILTYHWRHNYLDVGEDVALPDDFTEKEMQSGMWWRHLLAGGVAGMVSRTATAPLDRIKVFLQVRKCVNLCL
jgi:solute carrier family 25 phosphate transporter 23/24/25/41